MTWQSIPKYSIEKYGVSVEIGLRDGSLRTDFLTYSFRYHYCEVAWNAVNVTVILVWTTTCRPKLPADDKELSVSDNIQVPGWLPPIVGQTLALRLLPETLKSKVYEVPVVAAKGVLPSWVNLPPTFFSIVRLVPSMKASYQSLVSV